MSDRGVSTVVSYVLTLGIVVLLLTTLVGVFAPLVTNQQDDAVRSNLDVFGNDLAGDLESADRLAGGGDNVTVEVRTRLPDRVGGSAYEIEVNATAERITLWSPDHDTGMTVTFTTEVDVRDPGLLDGGPLKITYDTDERELVIQNA